MPPHFDAATVAAISSIVESSLGAALVQMTIVLPPGIMSRNSCDRCRALETKDGNISVGYWK
jgi:hypothetical protein